MCTFITGTINADVDPAVLEELHQRRHHGFEVFDESVMADAVPRGRRYLLHRTGHCDCGTVLGSATADMPEAEPAYTDKEVDRLRQKGWTDARTQRWIDSRVEAHERRTDTRHRIDTTTEWVELVRSVLDLPTVEAFGLIHHTYAGDLAATAFKIRTLTKGVADVAADDLVNLPEDTLIEFVR